MRDGFFGLLKNCYQDCLDRPFLRLSDATALTYGDLDERSARAARWLTSLGVGVGDRVVVQLPKSVDTVAVYLAVLRLGAVYVPLNVAYTPAEVDWFIADAQPAAVLQDLAVVSAGIDAADGGIEVVERHQDDLAALVYTSGTTGRPKGAMLTHGNLAANALTLRSAWAFSSDDVLLHVLPIFHVHGLMVALHTAMVSACEVVFVERFDAQDALERLAGVTVMMGVPTHYSRLMELEGFNADTCRNIRLLVSGSAPMTAELHRSVHERSGCAVLERYGMSETLMLTSNPYDGERLPGTVGTALSGVEVRVCDDAGQVVLDYPGMVQVRGPSVGPGYWRRADATASSRSADGWFITGDIGRIDGAGRLRLEGRAGDMIISGGLNVYPVEIEQVLDAHAAVVESAVVGLEHPDLGEAVTAFVVAHADGSHSHEQLRGELEASLSDLARFKHPKRYIFVEELPRNAMGKVLKAQLRNR